MIEFIIQTKDIFYRTKYKFIIDRIMMNYDLEYQVNYNIDYTNDNYKIYIIELTNNIELIKIIRNKYDDWQSMIITISDNDYYRYELLNNNYLILDYIERNYYSENKLQEDIIIALKNYYQRPNTLKFTYKKIYYSIDYQKILWIEKEPNTKRCIIKTINGNYYIQESLKQVFKELNKNFIQCNKSYIINMLKVTSYDIKNNIIQFENEIPFYNISRDKKKEIIDYFNKKC